MRDNSRDQSILQPLSEVAEIVYGTRVVKKRDQGTQYPVYGGGGATFSVDQTNRNDCTIVARFGMSEECVRYVSGDFFLNDSGLTVESLDSTLLLQEFLDVQLLGRQSEIYALGRGTAQKNLDVSAFKNLPIAVPALEEQQQIVAVLGEAFERLNRARAHAEANVENAQELFTASLRALFSDNRKDWPLRNIADVCIEFGRGKSRHRPRNDPRLYGGDIPFVQTGDLSKADHFLRDFSQTYSVEGVAQSRLWPKGTVCVAIVGATIGESAILDFDACFPDSVIGMVPDPSKAESEFLEFLLQFVKADLKEAGKGSARDNINLGTFSDRLFPIPDLKAQLTAIERISQIDRECRQLGEDYAAKLQDLDNLRQSLLQKAFAGELTRAEAA